MYSEIKGEIWYDLVNYNHTLYHSVFIVVCAIVNFKEATLTESVFTICKTGIIKARNAHNNLKILKQPTVCTFSHIYINQWWSMLWYTHSLTSEYFRVQNFLNLIWYCCCYKACVFSRRNMVLFMVQLFFVRWQQ